MERWWPGDHSEEVIKMKLMQLVKMLEFVRKEFSGDYSPLQFSVLLYAEMRPGITQTELCQILNVNQGTISRACKRLSSDTMPRGESGYGLVDNRPDEVYDARRLAVYLTPAGKDFMAKVKNHL
jgi:DNA-binding MarR family transcriptional regulator